MKNTFPKLHPAFESVACNLCGSTQATVLYPSTLPQDLSIKVTKRFAPADHVSGNDQIVKCPRCGLIYVNPRVKPEFVWRGYSDADDTRYATQTEGRLATFEHAVDFIESYVAKQGKLLDVGSAAGFFLKVAKDAGWKVQGIEPNKGLAAWGSKEYDIPISTDDFLKSKLPDASFDVVTFWDVLEHVSDPRAYVREAARVLKPGGYLFVNYPDVDSISSRIFKQKWWFISPVHLYYFNRKTLMHYFEEEGLMFKAQKNHRQTLALGYLFIRFADYNKAVSKLGRAIIGGLGLANFPMKYYAGQAVAVAQKL